MAEVRPNPDPDPDPDPDPNPNPDPDPDPDPDPNLNPDPNPNPSQLFTLRPLFPGTSEADQIYKITSVLGANPNPNP